MKFRKPLFIAAHVHDTMFKSGKWSLKGYVTQAVWHKGESAYDYVFWSSKKSPFNESCIVEGLSPKTLKEVSQTEDFEEDI